MELIFNFFANFFPISVVFVSAPLALLAIIFGARGVWVFGLIFMALAAIFAVGAIINDPQTGEMGGALIVIGLSILAIGIVTFAMAWFWYWIVFLLGWLPKQRRAR
jgi:hypothetical protein